ncbi:MAG TPA: hypothetical protein VEO56_13480 [Bacteroidota bacterium]|nr:hypothetical protein [Bacteroidota bacterium]
MKRASVLILLLFGASLSRAQFIRGWGIEGGAVGAYQAFIYTPGNSSPAIPAALRWGYTGGLFVEFLNVPHVSMVLDAAYTQKGRTVTSQEVSRSAAEPAYLSSGPVGLKPYIDYLRVAFLMKVRTGREGFVPYAGLGPRFDFILSRHAEGTPVLDPFKKADIGISLALGVEIVPRRLPLFSVEARWSPSFSKAYTNSILTIKNDNVDLLFALWL